LHQRLRKCWDLLLESAVFAIHGAVLFFVIWDLRSDRRKTCQSPRHARVQDVQVPDPIHVPDRAKSRSDPARLEETKKKQISSTDPIFACGLADPIGNQQSKKKGRLSRPSAESVWGRALPRSRVSPQRRARLGSSAASLPQAVPAQVVGPSVLAPCRSNRQLRSIQTLKKKQIGSHARLRLEIALAPAGSTPAPPGDRGPAHLHSSGLLVNTWERPSRVARPQTISALKRAGSLARLGRSVVFLRSTPGSRTDTAGGSERWGFSSTATCCCSNQISKGWELGTTEVKLF
jgi:hypothetical protein